jgi:hypothetical protein
MGRVTRLRKIRRLETRASGVAASVAQLEEIRRDRALSAAVARLSDENLRTLGPLIDAAIEDVEGGGAYNGRTDLYSYAATERDVRALRALKRALAAVQSEADQELTTRGA